jgi:acyl carrier protein
MASRSVPPAGHEAVPFATETEHRVGGIWSEILRVEPIGRTSHFFQLGGQSLLAMRMIARIRRDFGMKVPVSTVFNEPTVERFSAALDAMQHSRSIL